MSLATVSKSMLRYIDCLNISDTKKKCILKLCYKQIPKVIQKDEFNSDICPICKEKVKVENKYCSNCGQHLIIKIKDEKNLMIELIDDNTLGNFKANSNIGEVDIFIKWGFIKIYKDKTALMFNINDEDVFCERDNDILLVADKENLKGIVIYKPLEKVKINPNEIVSFEGFKQVRKFNPNIK